MMTIKRIKMNTNKQESKYRCKRRFKKMRKANVINDNKKGSKVNKESEEFLALIFRKHRKCVRRRLESRIT